MCSEKTCVNLSDGSLKAEGLNYSLEEITAQLNRILKSPLFAHSARLGRFLSFTVERAAAGKPKDLKEYSVGVEVYDRKPPYHPNEDSIVRTEARRLRTKLKQYYEGEGKTDPIQFYYRPGSYVPVFRKIESCAEDSQNMTSSEADRNLAAGVLITVVPFVDVSSTALASSLARGLTDEVMHCLMRTEGCRVNGHSTIPQLDAATRSAPDASLESAAQVALEGTVREDSGRIRITFTFVSLPGLESWSDRIEGVATAQSLFEFEEQVARAIVGRFAPRSSKIKYRRRNPMLKEVAFYPDLLATEALLDRGDKLSAQRALDKFKTIQEERPWCARASCGIAQSFYVLAMLGEPLDTSRTSEALRAANNALNIDPERAEAHAASGCALMLQHDWPGADRSFTRGIHLGTHATAHRLYADFLTSRGRFDEAFQRLEHAQNIDPFSYRQKVSYSRFCYLSRRYDDGFEYRAALTQYGPVPPEVSLFEALAYIHLGKFREANVIAEAMVPKAAGSPAMLADACGILSLSGARLKAEALCKSHRLLDSGTSLTAVRKALLALALEDERRAELLFIEALSIREAELCWVGLDPRCDRMQEHPLWGHFSNKVPDEMDRHSTSY